MRAHFRTILLLLLTAALLGLFLRQADFNQVWREIRAANVTWLLAALVATAATYVLRALRWVYLLHPIGAVHLPIAFRTTVIGFAASFLLPARAGEFIRPYLLARREGLSAAATFATIIIERLLDLATILLLLGLFLLTFQPGPSLDPTVFRAVKAGGLVAAAGAVGALSMIFIASGYSDRLGTAVRRLEAVLPRRIAHGVARIAERFVLGFAVMREPRQLLAACVLSFPLWLSICGGVWFVMRAFHMTLPFLGSFLVASLLVIGVSVPTPGAVGGFHEAFRIGATVFYGFDNDRSIGAAIVLHAISFVPVTLLGVAFMLQDGLSLGRVRRMAARSDDEGAVAPPEVAEAHATGVSDGGAG